MSDMGQSMARRDPFVFVVPEPGDMLRCPGCDACMPNGPMCAAFWDEDWRGSKRTEPCVFCGGGPDVHRPMPSAVLSEPGHWTYKDFERLYTALVEAFDVHLSGPRPRPRQGRTALGQLGAGTMGLAGKR